MPDLLERVLSIADAFDREGIPHSFGGAIALGFYAEVRLTHDIDINVYLDANAAEPALACLHELGVEEASAENLEAIRRDAQTRLRWNATPIDLFFMNLAFHRSCFERIRRFDLLRRPIQVLSPEDLIVCKVAFAREKDARDIDNLLDAMGGKLDLSYVLRWVGEIVGPDAPSARRLSRALRVHSLPAEG